VCGAGDGAGAGRGAAGGCEGMLGRGGIDVMGGAGRGGGGGAGRGAGGTAGRGAIGVIGAAGLGAATGGAGCWAGAFRAGAFLAGDLAFTVFLADLFADFFADFLAAFFAGRFLAATLTRLFFRAGAAFLVLVFLAFFAFVFFAMIDLPIVRLLPIARHPPITSARAATAIAFPSDTAERAVQTVSTSLLKAPGTGPPVAQSISSTGWTTGISVPPAICVMQPTLPAAITSGATFAMHATLRSRNAIASCGCNML